MLKDVLKEKFGMEIREIKVRGEISGTNWAEVSITSLNNEPITLGTPFNTIKFRAQILTSGSATFSQGNYRIDNSHGPLHQHWFDSKSSVNVPTLSGALLMILGSDYWELEKKV